MSVTLKDFSTIIDRLPESPALRSLLLQLATQLCELDRYTAAWREETLRVDRDINQHLQALDKRCDELLPGDPAALDALRAKVGLLEQQQINDNCRERSLNRGICDRLDELERREIPDLTATRADIADLHARVEQATNGAVRQADRCGRIEARLEELELQMLAHGQWHKLNAPDPLAMFDLPKWHACAIQRTMNGVIVHDPLVQGAAAGYVFGDLRAAADFVVAVLSQEKGA